MRKVDFLMQRRYQGYKSRGPGTELAESIPKIREHFRSFKPVSHLWAAYFLDPDQGDAESRGLRCPQPFGDFLRVAEEFRAFGETTLPERVNKPKPYFGEDELWRVPDDFSLKGGEVKIEFEPIKELIEENIGDYREEEARH